MASEYAYSCARFSTWNSLLHELRAASSGASSKLCLITCIFNFMKCDYKTSPGHHLRTIQTIVENIYVWLVGPWRLVSKRYGHRLEIFLLAHL